MLVLFMVVSDLRVTAAEEFLVVLGCMRRVTVLLGLMGENAAVC